MKRRVKNYFVWVSLLLLFATGTVYAHVGDVYDGEYADDEQQHLKLLIDTSAITNSFTMTVYRSALDWNNISSNVEVSVTPYHTGMSDAGFFYVRGLPSVYEDGRTGDVIVRDQNGNVINGDGRYDEDWYDITIYINTDTSAYASDPYFAQIMKKNVIHEVGHALKLAHPIKDSSCSGHVYAGYPLSVMNQGIITLNWVSATVSNHDRENLIYKWGE